MMYDGSFLLYKNSLIVGVMYIRDINISLDI